MIINYLFFFFFFFNDTATTEIYTLSLHDALPIFVSRSGRPPPRRTCTPRMSAPASAYGRSSSVWTSPRPHPDPRRGSDFARERVWMKVLFTKRTYAPMGGSESLAYQWATRLAARGRRTSELTRLGAAPPQPAAARHLRSAPAAVPNIIMATG